MPMSQEYKRHISRLRRFLINCRVINRKFEHAIQTLITKLETAQQEADM